MRQLTFLTILAFVTFGSLSWADSSAQTAQDQVLAALAKYHAAERAGDVATILDAYSEEFTDWQGTGKAVLGGFFQAIVDQGILDNLKVDMDATVVVVDGDVASAKPITYTTALGSDTYAYTLRKEVDGQWRFVYSEMVDR